MVRCPQCAEMQEVGPRAVSHRCTSCNKVWWWAVCRGCDRLQRVPDSLEAWRCGCGASNRSWWRTAPSDRSDAAAAVEARRLEESRLLPRPSRRMVAAAALAIVAAVGMSVARASAGAGGGGNEAAAACAAFREYRSKLQAGLPAPPDDIVAKAMSASSDVRDAAHRLLAASRSSDPDAVLAAVGDLTVACHPNGPSSAGTAAGS